MKPSAFLRELLQTHEQRAASKQAAWKKVLKTVAQLQACLTSDEAFHIVTQGAQELFSATSGILYVRKDPGDFQVQAVGAWGKSLHAEPAFRLHQCQALRLMK